MDVLKRVKWPSNGCIWRYFFLFIFNFLGALRLPHDLQMELKAKQILKGLNK